MSIYFVKENILLISVLTKKHYNRQRQNNAHSVIYIYKLANILKLKQ